VYSQLTTAPNLPLSGFRVVAEVFSVEVFSVNRFERAECAKLVECVWRLTVSRSS
jgi:hypothetical protein